MTTEQDPTAPNVTTKLRAEVFTEVCAERGLKTRADQAKALGVSDKTIKRIAENGDTASGEFIAKALALWPRLSFRSLFAVIDNATGQERR